MSEEIKISLRQVEAIDPSPFYTEQDLTLFGFEDHNDFRLNAVVVSFRVEMKQQVFPLRIWLRKADVPEERWVPEARRIAVEIMRP